MKVLIIGASGMLAGPVIRKMDEAGYSLRLFSRTINPSMFINDYDILKGDLFNPDDLSKAISGCDAIHISITSDDEGAAVGKILEQASRHGVKLISMVSGCTVSEEHRWFKFIDNKYKAEQQIIASGIPYLIFRPTWFFESLELMVRKGKAMIPGKQPHSSHWVAADDFGRMVAKAYTLRESRNRTYYIYGPQRFVMKDLLEKYCHVFHPEIEKVAETPLALLRTIAFLTSNKALKGVADLFSYFSKVKEPEISEENYEELGKPQINFETWITLQKQGI